LAWFGGSGGASRLAGLTTVKTGASEAIGSGGISKGFVAIGMRPRGSHPLFHERPSLINLASLLARLVESV